jgi:hypothetical protein
MYQQQERQERRTDMLKFVDSLGNLRDIWSLWDWREHEISHLTTQLILPFLMIDVDEPAEMCGKEIRCFIIHAICYFRLLYI